MTVYADIALDAARAALGRPRSYSLDDLQSLISCPHVPAGIRDRLTTAFAYAGEAPLAALSALETEEGDEGVALESLLLRALLMEELGRSAVSVRAQARNLYAKMFTAARVMIERSLDQLALDLLARILPLIGPLLAGRSNIRMVTAQTLNLIGCGLHDLSHFTDAIRVYDVALTLLDDQSERDLFQKARIMSNIGSLHQTDGHFEKSGLSLEAAVAIYEKLVPASEAVHGLAAALVNLGQSESYRGRAGRAESHWHRAIEVCNAHGLADDAVVVDAFIHLTCYQFETARWEEAREGLRAAWRVAVRGRYRSRRAELVAMAAQACLRGEDIGRAVHIFRLAADRYDALAPDNINDRIDALRGLARALGYNGSYAEASRVARSAINLGQKVLRPLHDQIMRTKGLLADLSWETGAFAEGLDWAQAALDDCVNLFPRDHFWSLKYRGTIADFPMVLQRWTDAFDILLDCLEDEAGLTHRLVDGDSDLVDLPAMRTARSQLELAAIAALRLSPQESTRLQRLVEIQLHFNGSAAAELAARKRHAAADPRRYLDRLLESGSTLVATTMLAEVEGQTRRILGICSCGLCTFQDIGTAAMLDLELEAWVRRGATRAGKAADVLIGALRSAAGGCDRLIWLPDHKLALYPLQVLAGATAPSPLQKLAVVQTRDIHSMFGADAVSPYPPLVVGISEFSDGDGGMLFESLPAVRQEVDALRVLFSDRRFLTNATATPEAVLSALESRPCIVHFATHGLTSGVGRGRRKQRRALKTAGAGDPLASIAVVLAPGHMKGFLLTARQLASLDLSVSHFLSWRPVIPGSALWTRRRVSGDFRAPCISQASPRLFRAYGHSVTTCRPGLWRPFIRAALTACGLAKRFARRFLSWPRRPRARPDGVA